MKVPIFDVIFLSYILALAHQFVRAGSKLILAARSIDKLELIKQELVQAHQVRVIDRL